ETLEEAFPLANVGSLKTLAGCFGFSGGDADKSCRVLSGGEKARVVLAKILYARPNFLVLDEPTNHLDITTKDMIVRSLADYEGPMLFVSPDRRFLARLSNRVLELGPDGPTLYGGGYTEYVARSGHEAPGLREAPAKDTPMGATIRIVSNVLLPLGLAFYPAPKTVPGDLEEVPEKT